MLISIHDWITLHQVTMLVIGILFPIPFTIFASEIRAFVLLPPRRLNLWILEARLSSANAKLRSLRRRDSDIGYRVSHYFVYLSTIVATIGVGLSIGMVAELEAMRGVFGRKDIFYASALVIINIYAALGTATKLANHVSEDMSYEASIEKLEERIEKIRAALHGR